MCPQRIISLVQPIETNSNIDLNFYARYHFQQLLDTLELPRCHCDTEKAKKEGKSQRVCAGGGARAIEEKQIKASDSFKSYLQTEIRREGEHFSLLRLHCFCLVAVRSGSTSATESSSENIVFFLLARYVWHESKALADSRDVDSFSLAELWVLCFSFIACGDTSNNIYVRRRKEVDKNFIQLSFLLWKWWGEDVREKIDFFFATSSRQQRALRQKLLDYKSKNNTVESSGVELIVLSTKFLRFTSPTTTQSTAHEALSLSLSLSVAWLLINFNPLSHSSDH